MAPEDADALLDALRSDHRGADLDAADRAMLEYVVRLTEAPATITRDHVGGLRAHGFKDQAVHDICSIAAYYAFVNRIADGLGVELESEEE